MVIPEHTAIHKSGLKAASSTRRTKGGSIMQSLCNNHGQTLCKIRYAQSRPRPRNLDLEIRSFKNKTSSLAPPIQHNHATMNCLPLFLPQTYFSIDGAGPEPRITESFRRYELGPKRNLGLLGCNGLPNFSPQKDQSRGHNSRDPSGIQSLRHQSQQPKNSQKTSYKGTWLTIRSEASAA